MVQHLLYQIKTQQFYTDLDLYQQCYVLQKIEELKDFSRHLSDFSVLFKAYLLFKDFSRKPSKFKYFSSLCEPCFPCKIVNIILSKHLFQVLNWDDSFEYPQHVLNGIEENYFFITHSYRDANPKWRSSGTWKAFFRNLRSFSGMLHISP